MSIVPLRPLATANDDLTAEKMKTAALKALIRGRVPTHDLIVLPDGEFDLRPKVDPTFRPVDERRRLSTSPIDADRQSNLGSNAQSSPLVPIAPVAHPPPQQ